MFKKTKAELKYERYLYKYRPNYKVERYTKNRNPGYYDADEIAFIRPIKHSNCKIMPFSYTFDSLIAYLIFDNPISRGFFESSIKKLNYKVTQSIANELTFVFPENKIDLVISQIRAQQHILKEKKIKIHI